MEMKNALLLLFPIIAAVLSSYFTYYFAIKSKRSEAILKFKEEKYANLLVLLQGFMEITVSGDAKRKFFEEQYRSWLYCSDDVVKSINKMVELIISSRGKSPDPTEGRKIVGNIVIAMRKDLLGKTNLTHSDFRYTAVLENK
ncbi:MAG: hypothetical protein WC081_01240 [Candidatus Ratteibacteria bacterium]|jgi:hypothetical protein